MFSSSKPILDFFRTRNLDEESQSYLGTHAKRYAFLLERVSAARSTLMKSSLQVVNILDIGPSFFTELLREAFKNDAVLTLGYDSPESRGGHFPEDISHERSRHFSFDLNDAQYRDRWIQTPSIHLAVMAEVLEHLYTAPTLVLGFVFSLIKPSGFLIVETPNAASLKKRLRLLVGRHPYEMIRENAKNPGHYREYTRDELLKISRSVGFEVISCELSNYFSHDSSRGLLERFLRGLSPASFRRGVTLVLRKPGND